MIESSENLQYVIDMSAWEAEFTNISPERNSQQPPFEWAQTASGIGIAMAGAAIPRNHLPAKPP
jgi:hypothetical protein